MSEVPKRAWWFYVDDMIAAVEKALAYTRGFDQAGFEASGLHYDATVRNLELLGEAATAYAAMYIQPRLVAAGIWYVVVWFHARARQVVPLRKRYPGKSLFVLPRTLHPRL